MAIDHIADRGPAHGVPSAVVDGNDVEAVHDEVRRAVERARAGDGPTLIEAKTMRMLGHAIHDGAEYVPEPLLAEWRERDPIARHRARLRGDGVSEEELVAIDEDCKVIVADAIEFAETGALPDPGGVTDGVYAP